MEKKRIVSIVVLIIGLVTLVIGAVFLVLKLTSGPAMADGDYLVSVGNWVLESNLDSIEDNSGEDDPEPNNLKAPSNCENQAEENDGTNCETNDSGVIWQFTEIGKGTLTTNNHLNDYEFAWALQEGQMLVQTEWLYELNNKYDYTLDQGEGVLVLSDGANEYRFVAQTE